MSKVEAQSGCFEHLTPTPSPLNVGLSKFSFFLSGDPPYQMLEIQLVLFMDLPARMNPGMFVVASDCVELFNNEGDWSLTKPGFTALAHPSPIIIGTTHGVFKLADHEVGMIC